MIGFPLKHPKPLQHTKRAWRLWNLHIVQKRSVLGAASSGNPLPAVGSTEQIHRWLTGTEIPTAREEIRAEGGWGGEAKTAEGRTRPVSSSSRHRCLLLDRDDAPRLAPWLSLSCNRRSSFSGAGPSTTSRYGVNLLFSLPHGGRLSTSRGLHLLHAKARPGFMRCLGLTVFGLRCVEMTAFGNQNALARFLGWWVACSCGF